MKAIIVDDEPRSQLALAGLLKEHHPEIEVAATGESVEEGYRMILNHRPEIVFLDIEMPDGTGFDLLQKFDAYNFQVIFVTAHNKYAITAIKFGALDYLLKPISKEDLAEAIQKAHRKQKERITEEQIQILLETIRNFEERKLPSRVAISTSEGILYKQVKDIIRLQAQQNYTEFSLTGQGRNVLASLNIGEYVEQFEPYREFMKVHRSHLVNLRHVDRLVKAEGGYLVMKDGAHVSVSRAYRDELVERLEQI